MARSIQRLCRAVRVHAGAKPDGVANAFLWGSEEDQQVVKLQEPRLVLSGGHRRPLAQQRCGLCLGCSSIHYLFQ